jgi:PAS domain S-box-containing protein
MNPERLSRLLGEYRRLRTYMDTVPDLICFKDSEHRFVEVNYAFADRAGSTPAQMRGHSGVEYFSPEWDRDDTEVEESVRRTREPAAARIVELSGDRQSWFSATTIPWFGSDGAVRGTVSVMRDITDLQIAKLGHRDRSRLQMAQRGLADYPGLVSPR